MAGRIKIAPFSACPALTNSARVIPAHQRSGKHPAGIQPTAQLVTNLATEVNPLDKVYFDDKLIMPKSLVYYALNKPVGYTTTTSDPHAEKLITELVPSDPPVFPVGRLDKDTSGLIFLTNDGDFAQKMTHPRYEKEKEYAVETDKPLSKESLNKLRRGIKLNDGMTAPAEIRPLAKGRTLGKHSRHSDASFCHSREGGNPAHKNNLYSITIHEGKNRQIRRMIEAIGAEVVSLKRIRIGDFKLGNLEEGECKKFDSTSF